MAVGMLRRKQFLQALITIESLHRAPRSSILRHSLLPASTSESWRQNWSNGGCTPEFAERGQVSAGTACCELANSASGLSDLHATARRS